MSLRSPSTMPEQSDTDSPSSLSRSSSISSFSSRSSAPSCMRVFLVQTARGLFSSSGGYKANICLLRYLASRGHSVRQLCYYFQGEAESYVEKAETPKKNLGKRLLHLRAEDGGPGTDVNVQDLVLDHGVQAVALESEAIDAAFGGKKNLHREMGRETAEYIEHGKISARLLNYVQFLQEEIIRFAPTHIIFNDGLSMQATSALDLPGRNICRIAVVHTAEQLPFGPFAGGMPGHTSSPTEARLLRELDGIWSVSDAIKRYALQYGQLETQFLVHHPWTYLEEKRHETPVRLSNWDKKYIGMINPCPVKGSHIVVNLAKACPNLEFLVHKSWGFNDEVRMQMEVLRNITIRPTCKDMEDAWRDIKVLLVPSMWFEAWGIVLVEAHLRGIPVVSSDAGALSEAMLGLDYIIPVNPINGEHDEKGAYVVPEQDIEPWVKVVNKLMTDQTEYEKLSQKVRETTVQWLKNLDETALEKWLMQLSVGREGLMI